MRTPDGNVIERVRSTPSGAALYDVVTRSLQRMAVTIPRKHTTEAEAGATIDHAVNAWRAPGKPRH